MHQRDININLFATMLVLAVTPIASGDFNLAAKQLRVVVLSGESAPGFSPEYTFGSLSYPGLTEDGNTFFRCGIYGPGNGAAAIWTEDQSGQLELAAIAQMTIPGVDSPIAYIPRDPVGNSNGHVAFTGEVRYSGTPRSNDGLWIASSHDGLRLVAQSFDAAPGGGVFTTVRDPVINELGSVAFKSHLLNPVGVEEGVWATTGGGTLNLVGSTGSSLSDTSDARFGYDFSWPKLNNRDQTFFTAAVVGSEFNGHAIFKHDPVLGIASLVRNGDQAPTLADGVKLQVRRYTEPTVGKNGGLAFFAEIEGPGIDAANNYALWSGNDIHDLRLVAQLGQAAPTANGERFGVLGDLVVNSANTVAFATLRTDKQINPISGYVDGPFHEDLWLQDLSSISKLVASQGAQAPDLDEGVIFDSFRPTTGLFLGNYAINDFGQVAFVSRLKGAGITSQNEKSLWVQDRNGELRLVAMPGMEVNVGSIAVPDVRTIQNFNLVLGNQVPSFNNKGQLAFSALFTDGSIGIVVSSIGTIPEPTGFALSAIGLAIVFTAGIRNKRNK